MSGAIGQLNQATQQNASASEELAATAEEMSSQAAQLQQAMAFFKLEAAGAGPATASMGDKPAADKTSRRLAKLAAGGESSIDEKEFSRF